MLAHYYEKQELMQNAGYLNCQVIYISYLHLGLWLLMGIESDIVASMTSIYIR